MGHHHPRHRRRAQDDPVHRQRPRRRHSDRHDRGAAGSRRCLYPGNRDPCGRAPLHAHRVDPRGRALRAEPGRARADRRRSGHAHHLVHGHRGGLLPRREEPAGPRIRRPQVGPSGRPRRRPRRHHLCRAHGHPARASRRGGQGHAAELRQPPAQRRALPRRPAPVHRPRRRQGPARLGRVEHDQPQRHGRPDHPASHAGRARAGEAATGRDDPAAVMAESFIQWVIEDDFSQRPAGMGAGRRADGRLRGAL